jgi:hypothetical protein
MESQKEIAYQLKKIKVLGISTDFNQCECCGKQDLAKTVTILDLDSGVELHFGVVCAAKANKYDSLEAMREAKKEISREVRKHADKIQHAHRITFRELKEAYGVEFFYDDPARKIGITTKLKCSQEVYDACYKQALVYAMLEWKEQMKIGPFKFKQQES